MVSAAFRSARRSGVATVEFAIAMLFLFPPLLLGLWEVGRMVEVQQLLSNAVREGARQAATGQLTVNQVQEVVTDYLVRAGLPDYQSTNPPTVTNLGTISTTQDGPWGGGGRDITGQAAPAGNGPQYLDGVQVSITIPLDSVRWVNLYLVTSTSTTLSATSIWMFAVDKGYPGVSNPPQG